MNNPHLKNPCVLPVALGCVLLALTGRLPAQTFTMLHNFAGNDGANPAAGLILSGNTLYGTTSGDGLGFGTVFAVNTDGTGFTTLHGDGGNPLAGLVLSGSTLYGTTYGTTLIGGYGAGTVFKVDTDGMGFTSLYIFSGGSDGFNPLGPLVFSGNTLYGTTHGGGSFGNGTVFAVNTDGNGFKVLHAFTAFSDLYLGNNEDGAFPMGGLILSGNSLYGTANGGGGSGNGTVFKLNTDGTGFTTLHSFTGLISGILSGTNSDGGLPEAGLILSGSTLYGTTVHGGSSGYGTLLALNTDGTGFTTLHNFKASEGLNPSHSLLLLGNRLYGTTYAGGSFRNGTVFAVNTDGTGFTTVHSFSAGGYNSANNYTNSDGAYPDAGLVLSGNTLYGTATEGGNSNHGTIFSISLLPQLTITPAKASVILMWPTNFTGFTLQSTTNLGQSPIWTTNLPPPVLINGQYTVTNLISGTQQFFRLSQ